MFLVTDLVYFQLNSENSGLAFSSELVFLKLMVDMLSKVDTLKKGFFLAIRSLLKLLLTHAAMLQTWESYDLNSLLYRLGVQLEELPSEEQKEYAGDDGIGCGEQCVLGEPNTKIDKQITQLGLPRARAYWALYFREAHLFGPHLALAPLGLTKASRDRTYPRERLAT